MQPAPPQSSICGFGDFVLDRQTGELRKNGIKLKIHGQPVEILGMLLERPGQLVTREELQNRLWAADTFVDFEMSLNAAVRRLREALNDSADKPQYVETVARRGYRFIGDVRVNGARSPLWQALRKCPRACRSSQNAKREQRAHTSPLLPLSSC